MYLSVFKSTYYKTMMKIIIQHLVTITLVAIRFRLEGECIE